MRSIKIKETDYITRRHKPDFLVVLYMSLLMMLGLIIIFAIGPQRANVLNNSYGSNYSDTYFFFKQAISLAIAISMFFLAAYIPYKKLSKQAGKLMVFALTSCLILAIAGWANMGIAQNTLGATRWFNLGPLGSLQPSEILKFAILIFSAVFLGSKSKQGKINNLNETLLPLAAITAVSLVFIVIVQKDLGTGMSFVGIIAAMLCVGGLNKKNSVMIIAVLLAIGLVFVISAPHRMDRIETFFMGDSKSGAMSDDGSYHIEHAKLAIGTGGLFGVGIGNSVQATGYLPEAINDSVFAIMAETFGFVGSVTILILFGSLLMRLLKIMDHLQDASMKLLIAGVFGWLSSHVILNIASMLGVVPLTGITLPLLSFGGTSMLFMAAALGLAFQMSHYTVHPSNIKEAKNENSSSRGRIRRSRHTSRSSSSRN